MMLSSCIVIDAVLPPALENIPASPTKIPQMDGEHFVSIRKEEEYWGKGENMFSKNAMMI